MRRMMFAAVLVLACSGGGGSAPVPDAGEEPPAPDAAGGAGSPKPDASVTVPVDATTPDLPAADAATADTTSPPDATPPDTAPTPAGNPFVYVGSELANSIRIFQLDLATGALTPRGMAAAGTSPDYLAFHPSGKYVYALNEVNPGRIIAFSVDRATGMLTRLNDASSGGDGPAHISVHKSGKWVLSSNYDSGHVAALPIMDDGRLGAPVAPRVAGAMAHMIIDDGVTGKFVFVPSKGDNRILQYKFDEATGALEPNSPPFVAQAGVPRHMVFHRSGKSAYLLTEMGRSVVSYKYDSTTGLLTDGVALVAGPTGNGAHIVLHPTKELLYVCLRFFDSVTTLDIDAGGRAQNPRHFHQQISIPWDMAFAGGGQYLLVANNMSATVKVLRLDESGAVSLVGNGAAVAPRARFVGVLP
jgi:6-phosphogluconolactonase